MTMRRMRPSELPPMTKTLARGREAKGSEVSKRCIFGLSFLLIIFS
jgi:hypothetical protein